MEERERYVDFLFQRDIVTCDICDSVATDSGACWTCTSGMRTVMHPVAFDVCEWCFVRHTGLRENSPHSILAPRRVLKRRYVGWLSKRLQEIVGIFR